MSFRLCACTSWTRGVMLALEICSASYYFDHTLETAIGNAICGDGAAAFLLSAGPGRHACYPEIVDFGSFLDPEHLDKVGFGRCEGKLRIILSSSVRHLAAPMIANAADPLLRRNCLGRSYIRFSVVHPGGPKVLAAYAEALGLDAEAFRHSRAVLRDSGNMSSPTCLFVLERTLAAGDIRAGQHAVLAALGPGFSSELVLLRGLA